MIDRLPELARFNEASGIKPGESLDLLLATTTQPICLFTSAENIRTACDYRTIIGKGGRAFEILPVDNPIQEASRLRVPGVIPLVIHSATDPNLFQRMFADGPSFGQLLMSHLYTPTPDHQSPSLHVVGIANQGLEIISESPTQFDESKAAEMTSRRRHVLGNSTLTNDDFRDILRSPSVRRIVAHALGPTGTNISQAMRQYIAVLGVEGKTDLIVHPTGIEPLAYAEMALQEIEEGVIPMHMECAVYYDMATLFNQRRNEVVLADHHYMQLDIMQLASIEPIEALVARGIMRIATHPTPQPLIYPWTNAGKAEWIKATSNSAAAHMVLAGQADACVTTASTLNEIQDLVSRHVFGSPMMSFTIATPLNQQQLRRYL